MERDARLTLKLSLASTAIALVCLGAVIPAQAPPVSGVFFNEGWESGSENNSFNSQYYGSAAASAQYSVQDLIRAGGNWALRLQIPANTPAHFVTQHIGDSIAGPVLAQGSGEHFMDLYVQYKVYYPVGFNWLDGFKQLIIGTQDDRRHEEVCCNPWVAHYLTMYTRSQGQLFAEGNNKQGPDPTQWIGVGPNLGYSGTNPFLLQTGRWYTIEIRKRLNDPGVDNGIMQIWADGQMIGDRRNIRWRVTQNGAYGANFAYGTNFVMLSNYSGMTGSTVQNIYYDDIKFSTTYIGTGGSTPTAPAAPRNLRIITSS